jgi:hypothetical protein
MSMNVGDKGFRWCFLGYGKFVYLYYLYWIACI